MLFIQNYGIIIVNFKLINIIDFSAALYKEALISSMHTLWKPRIA